MRFCLLFTLLATLASAQVTNDPVNLADVREDVRLLSQNLGALTLRVEQLDRRVAALQSQQASASANSQNFATVDQLNQAVADLNRTIKAAVATSRTEVLQRVAAQLEQLANQTNAALESINNGSRAPRVGGTAAAAPTPAAAPAAAPATTKFSDSYPKEGISYTVQRGDTLSKIATKTGAKIEDIINANKLSDPSRIRVGQALFIPGGK